MVALDAYIGIAAFIMLLGLFWLLQLRKQKHLLQISEERYRELFENAHDLIQSVRSDGTIEYTNPAWREVMGYDEDELANLTLFDIIDPESLNHCQQLFEQVMSGEKINNIEAKYLTKHGQTIFVRGNSSCQFENGKLVATRSIFHDVTARRLAECALFAEKERAQVTLASIGDAVITTDANGTIDYLNPVAESLTGWSLDNAFGQPLTRVFHIIHQETRKRFTNPLSLYLDKEKSVELSNNTVLVSHDGKETAIENSASPILDNSNQIIGAVLVFHDVSEQRRLTREITHQASHDALTGLVNRQEFECRIAHVLEGIRTLSTQHALCFMDLDQFKIVNDTSGHAAGDELLRQVSTIFHAKIRQRDTLGRLGGDEFGVLLEHCNLEQAQRVADAMRLAVEEFRFIWEDKSFRIGVSIGLVAIDKSSTDIESLMKAADSACYVAKDGGRNRIQVYREDDIDLAKRQGEIQWVTRIQRALDENRFQLNAQAIVPINFTKTGGLHYELLLRMIDEQGGIILPGVFMPAAERYQLSVQLDRWVIARAFSWLAQNPRHLLQLDQCAINLSGLSLGNREFEEFVIQQLKASKLDGRKICFEITETAAIVNLSEATRFIKHLKTYGCKFALDDFGTGLSSFAYLKHLPVDYLKIDGQFIKDILTDPLDLAMVRSINEIGQLMGKQTIAEWVDDERIFYELQKLGVDFAQGFSIERPVPLGEILLAA